MSFRVKADKGIPAGYELEWPSGNHGVSPLQDAKQFKIAATSLIAPLLRPSSVANDVKTSTSSTFVYPLGQFTPVLYPENTSTEHRGLTQVLQMLCHDDFSASKWTFTAGYFNMHPSYKELLLASKSERGTVITAAPEANGFYGSKGISKYLPPAYLVLSKRFLRAVVESKREDQVELLEWRRGTVGVADGWTYHAKGLTNYSYQLQSTNTNELTLLRHMGDSS